MTGESTRRLMAADTTAPMSRLAAASHPMAISVTDFQTPVRYSTTAPAPVTNSESVITMNTTAA